ncbi:SCO family protein [Natronobacterium texcoconense]|uniref:Protein SCO1/2 n=1 Tax=Natronobacterium texcoconense TaxID=1095778 RepID=A0A1H1AVY1_NATTX|nr:SCO family protein [Natronobacterium texcoconense]SDQ43691.1 protein SCO1/2 [Natronobacterium texcoconense]
MNSFDRLGRRTYLAATGSAVVGLTAGCTDLVSDQQYDRVVLEPPENYDALRDSRDRGELPHPIYGDELPDVSAPCTIRDEEIATGDFEGERHSLYTFIFARCHGACPALTSSLRHVQADSADNDYADDVALVHVTFDPEHDTPEVLEEYGHDHGVNYDLNNWYDLRPESEAAAQEYVMDEFGCFYMRNEDFEADDGHGDGHENDHDDDGHDEHDDHDDEPPEPDELDDESEMEMAFQHESMIVLANADGYVERTYTGDGLPSYSDLIDDVRTVAEEW